MRRALITIAILAFLFTLALEVRAHEAECFDEIDDRTGRISSCWDSRTMGNRTEGLRWLGHNGADTWGPNRINWYVIVKYFDDGERYTI